MKHAANIAQSAGSVEMAALVKARSDYAAGRGVSHDVVKHWLRTWGTAEQVPFAVWLTGTNG